jgi:hypothetical protein
MSASCGCTTTMYDFNAPLWFPTTPGITTMDPILLMFSIFTPWRLVWGSPDRGRASCKRVQDRYFERAKTTARILGVKGGLSFQTEDGTRRAGRGIQSFVRTLGPELFQCRPASKALCKSGGSLYWQRHMLMLPVDAAATADRGYPGLVSCLYAVWSLGMSTREHKHRGW